MCMPHKVKGNRRRKNCKGSSTCVCAVVCFQVGALCVRFATANVVTRVRRHPLPGPGAPTAFGLRLLGQAVPAGDHETLCRVKGWPT